MKPCGWDGNCRSGIALAVQHLQSQAQEREMSTRLRSLVDAFFYIIGSPLEAFWGPDLTRINLRKNGQIKQKTEKWKVIVFGCFHLQRKIIQYYKLNMS